MMLDKIRKAFGETKNQRMERLYNDRHRGRIMLYKEAGFLNKEIRLIEREFPRKSEDVETHLKRCREHIDKAYPNTKKFLEYAQKINPNTKISRVVFERLKKSTLQLSNGHTLKYDFESGLSSIMFFEDEDHMDCDIPLVKILMKTYQLDGGKTKYEIFSFILYEDRISETGSSKSHIISQMNYLMNQAFRNAFGESLSLLYIVDNGGYDHKFSESFKLKDIKILKK